MNELSQLSPGINEKSLVLFFEIMQRKILSILKVSQSSASESKF
jgi:hypothetical protein